MQITGTNQSAIYHNNFIQNDSQAYQSNTGITWDNGYPSGGNYWSNYAGVDNCSGPQQNICPSPDGIGDTPPSIDGTVYQDRYPLMKPFTAQNPASPPGVTVSPPTPNPASTGSVVNVAFSVSSSSTVTGITVNWGDGTAADNLAGMARSDSHVYTSTGAVKSKTFTITVTATNGAGPGSGTSSETINDQPPTVTISGVSPNPANTGQLVTVSFTGSDIDGSISSIGVNWGDGTPTHSLAGTATSDTHSYTATGTFTIMIVATDNSGSTGQVTGSVNVNIPTAAPYALVVTAEGKVYRFYQNGTLTLVGQPVTTPLRQVAWKPDGSYALIVGDFATLVKYDGTSLTTVPTGISTGFNFWSVSWKQDGSYALIGGSVGLLLKYDGVSVTQISNPGGTTILSMSWHPSGTYVVLSGKSGGLRTYDGSKIKSLP